MRVWEVMSVGLATYCLSPETTRRGFRLLEHWAVCAKMASPKFNFLCIESPLRMKQRGFIFKKKAFRTICSLQDIKRKPKA